MFGIIMNHVNVMALRISSFNCRGLKGSVTDLTLLSQSFDIICLQETWLMPNELCCLNNLIPNMSGFGVSAVDLSAGLLYGRPYGGVAFLWNKSLSYDVQHISSGYDWLVAISLADSHGNSFFTVINVYFPCDSYTNVDKYLDCLGKLQAFVSDIVGPYIILGDFNCNPQDMHSPCGKVLNDFMHDCDLEMIDSCLPSDSYTFISDAWQSSSWLDHCLGSQSVLDVLVNCHIIYDSFNSDHFPIAVTINLPTMAHTPADNCQGPRKTVSASLPKVDFSKVSTATIESFQSYVVHYLSGINLSDLDVFCCQKADCDNSEQSSD